MHPGNIVTLVGANTTHRVEERTEGGGRITCGRHIEWDRVDWSHPRREPCARCARVVEARCK